MAKFQRGIDQKHEVDPRQLLRDTRTVGEWLNDFFSNPNYVTVVMVMIAMFGIFIPHVSDLLIIIGSCIFTFSYTRRLTLPYRMPKRSGAPDYNDPKPGSDKPQAARGICFFGNERNTNEEIWFSNEDMRTHVLIFGSTGSGKTEALVSIAYNSLVQGSGFIYVDGKGDNSLYSKVFAMTRSLGREDDILIINFMTGARDIIGPQERRLSNTMNPFARGSSSMLAQLVVSLMDAAGGSSDGDMWKGRAIAFVEALMRILVYARDKEMILLDANAIRNFFLLERIEAMVMDRVLIRDNQEPASLVDVPDLVMEPIQNYLYNLPGYDKSKKNKQVSQVLEQHGFITMQLTKVFSSMADTYGHILRTQLAEVDVQDVVLNRRILVVLLPALEKSPDELANLGKVIVASLKAMMASGLGEDVEGDYRDVILRKPTNAPTPYLCILDEYGYYAVPGFAVVPAQARSLGFSAVFAGQDLPAFQKASKEEAASIGANTNIKICMKMEDPVETLEFFMKTAGEAYVTKVDHFQTKAQSILNNYMDTKSASFEKRSRIDSLDLKEQREGEAHIFFKSTITRAKMFYANPKPVKVLRINHFLKVEKPKTRKLVEFVQRITAFQQSTQKTVFFAEPNIDKEDLAAVIEVYRTSEAKDPIEKGVSALLAHYNQQQTDTSSSDEMYPSLEAPMDETLSDKELNIFVTFRPNSVLSRVLQVRETESFRQELLKADFTQRQLEIIERLSGQTERNSKAVAADLMRDIRAATYYPPRIVDTISAEDLTGIVHELCGKITTARAAAAAEKKD